MQDNLKKYVIFTLKKIRDEAFEWTKKKNPSPKHSSVKSLTSFINNPFKRKYALDKKTGKITDIPVGLFQKYLKSIGDFLEDKIENNIYSEVKVYLVHLRAKKQDEKKELDEKLKERIKAYAAIKNEIRLVMEQIVAPEHFEFIEVDGKTKKALKEQYGTIFTDEEINRIYQEHQ